MGENEMNADEFYRAFSGDKDAQNKMFAKMHDELQTRYANTILLSSLFASAGKCTNEIGDVESTKQLSEVVKQMRSASEDIGHSIGIAKNKTNDQIDRTALYLEAETDQLFSEIMGGAIKDE